MALLDEVAKTTIKLMVREPFYGHFFVSVLKRHSDVAGAKIGIGLVARSIVLSVGAQHWRERLHTGALRYGAIKHQVLHLVFKHIVRSHEFGDPRLFEIAADLVANQYLANDQRAEDAVVLADFESLRLRPFKGVDYYYRILSRLRDERPADHEAAGLRLCELLAAESSDDHSGWSSLRSMSDGERSIFDSELDRTIRESAVRTQESFGSLPGRLRMHLADIVARTEAQVPWRRVLRLFSTSSRRTSIRSTIRRPSKRYGTTPGIKVVRHHKVLVAVDTSGSIDTDELVAFFAEIDRIYKQGAEVFVVECDVTIGHSYPYSGRVPQAVSGRGGTSFEAPIRYANEVYVPDALIYFTDGYAPTPTIRCRKPILWVISSAGLPADHADYRALPGQKVKLDLRSGT